MPQFKQLGQMTNVGAGKEASFALPLGPTYNSVMFDLEDLTVSEIEEVTLEINSTPVRTYKGDFLKVRNSHRRKSDTTDTLIMHFAEQEMREAIGEDALALGTADLPNPPVVKVKIADTIVGTSPDIKVIADSSPIAQPMGVFLCVERITKDNASAGRVQVHNLPVRDNRSYYALHLATEDANNVLFKLGERELVKGSRKAIHAKGSNKRSAQSGYTHIDLLPTNRLSDAPSNNVTAALLEYDRTATGSIDIHLESIKEFKNGVILTQAQ